MMVRIRPGQRRYVSLNSHHPWHAELLQLGRALAKVGKPRILFATESRPKPLARRVDPTWDGVKDLLGSPGKTAITAALLASHTPIEVERRTGVTAKQIHVTIRRLFDSQVLEGSFKQFSMNEQAVFFRPLQRFLKKLLSIVPLAIASSANNVSRWEVPTIFGTRVRTMIIALLAQNGPSEYADLVRSLGIARASAFCDLGLLERMGVVCSKIAKDTGKRCFILDERFVAYAAIRKVGTLVAERSQAPIWRLDSEMLPTDPIGYSGGSKRPWLFKRNWKTKALLLVHAAGALTYEDLAVAIGTTHVGARRAADYLVRDGLIMRRKRKQYFRLTPNLKSPYARALNRLIQQLLRSSYPELVGIVRALPSTTRPKSLYG
jgi:predicted transcriptional regulator